MNSRSNASPDSSASISRVFAAASAARTLGADHSATRAFAQAAAITMAPADLWWARLTVKTLRRDQREVCLANSYYVYKSPLFHRLVNPGGNGTIGVHA